MTKRSEDLSDYKLVFDAFDNTIATLDPEIKVQFLESAQVSEEVEALREITEQVNAEASGLHLLTLG